MGLFNRKKRVSADGFALEICRLIALDTLDGPESLDARFRTLGFQSHVPDDRYFAETVVVGAFPYDVILALDHGDSAVPVRQRLREMLLTGLNGRRREIGSPEVAWDGWNRLLEQRFREYSSALQSRLGPEGWQAASVSAATNITGSPDMGVAMAVAIHFAGTMKVMRPALQSYSIQG